MQKKMQIGFICSYFCPEPPREEEAGFSHLSLKGNREQRRGEDDSLGQRSAGGLSPGDMEVWASPSPSTPQGPREGPEPHLASVFSPAKGGDANTGFHQPL